MGDELFIALTAGVNVLKASFFVALHCQKIVELAYFASSPVTKNIYKHGLLVSFSCFVSHINSPKNIRLGLKRINTLSYFLITLTAVVNVLKDFFFVALRHLKRVD